ncbi:conserved Plasmodium protein, unknown function [Plasmodium ovale]|uniref:Chorein N-terminal domain-containing protein n=1 Tax=Plasmodium ovale TaxID=36330 RepID=A0A1C3KPE6_PLAOA|nr:conserved Plasmodium protein, unknown function [Plasmodium ovale]
MIDVILRMFFGKYFESCDNNFLTMNMNAGIEIRNIIIKNDEINHFLKSKNIDIEIVYLKIERINISFITLSGILTLKLQGVDLRVKPHLHRNASKGIKNKLTNLLKNNETVNISAAFFFLVRILEENNDNTRSKLANDILCCSCEKYKDMENSLCCYNNYNKIKTYICSECSVLKSKDYDRNVALIKKKTTLKNKLDSYTNDISHILNVRGIPYSSRTNVVYVDVGHMKNGNKLMHPHVKNMPNVNYCSSNYKLNNDEVGKSWTKGKSTVHRDDDFIKNFKEKKKTFRNPHLTRVRSLIHAYKMGERSIKGENGIGVNGDPNGWSGSNWHNENGFVDTTKKVCIHSGVRDEMDQEKCSAPGSPYMLVRNCANGWVYDNLCNGGLVHGRNENDFYSVIRTDNCENDFGENRLIYANNIDEGENFKCTKSHLQITPTHRGNDIIKQNSLEGENVHLIYKNNCNIYQKGCKINTNVKKNGEEIAPNTTYDCAGVQKEHRNASSDYNNVLYGYNNTYNRNCGNIQIESLFHFD